MVSWLVYVVVVVVRRGLVARSSLVVVVVVVVSWCTSGCSGLVVGGLVVSSRGGW